MDWGVTMSKGYVRRLLCGLVTLTIPASAAIAGEISPFETSKVCERRSDGSAFLSTSKAQKGLIGSDATKFLKANNQGGLTFDQAAAKRAAIGDLRITNFLKYYDRRLFRYEPQPGCQNLKPSDLRGDQFLDPSCARFRCRAWTPPPAGKPQPKQVQADLRLRLNAENLRTKLTDSNKSNAKTKPAIFSLNRNLLTETTTANSELAAGVAFDGYLKKVQRRDGQIELFNPFSLIPYVTYQRRYTTESSDTEIDQLGSGLLFDFVLLDPKGQGIGHEIAFKAEYLSDSEGETSIANGELIYYPLLNLGTRFDPFGGLQPIGPLALYIEPSGHFRFGHVFDAGGNTALATEKDFNRAGGKIRAVLTGNPTDFKTVLDKFTLSAEYIWLYGSGGSLDTFRRFDAALIYTFGVNNNYGVGLNYRNGHTDTTLQKVEFVQGAFTVKY
jgi:hypothetical protein